VRRQRWAIVGTGTISRTVVPDLQSCSGAEVVVVHSRDGAKAARFAAEFGIPASTDDYDALLADESIDAVYLATPFATHHPMTRQALRAGKHVLVEKPMALNADEVADLFQVAAAQGVFVMEAMWMKFNPAYRRLHQEIAEGLIGEPRSMRAAFSMPLPNDGGSRWDMTRSGGALLDQGIYPVTLAYSVFGMPATIHAVGVTQPDGLDLAEHITFEFSDGRFAQCASGMTEFSDLSAAVSGRRGWIGLSSPFWATDELSLHAGSWTTIFRSPNKVKIEREGNGYVPMLREVLEAIEQGVLDHPVHPAADTIAVFRILDEIFEQIRGPVQLGSRTWNSPDRITASVRLTDPLSDRP
jgi:predicted dehydrogenase